MGALRQPQQLQFDLFDPIESRQLPKYGWWTLNTKYPDGLKQTPYKLGQMEFVLNHCRKDVDQYMSQAFFATANRRAINISAITHGFVDLDVYDPKRNIRAASFTHSEMVTAIRMFCDDEGIPQPTMIISSGRGYYLKWMWDQPLPRKLAGVYTALLAGLIECFESFGSDRSCKDLSRILRVVGTVNSKNGERAKILDIAECNGQPLTHRFEEVCNQVFKYSFDQVKEFRREAAEFEKRKKHYSPAQIKAFAAYKARKSGLSTHAWTDWHWKVVEDILTLTGMRGGRIKEGQRAIFGHLLGCNLAPVVAPGQLYHELVAYSRMILPSDYIEKELKNHASTLMSRYKDAQAGKTVEYNGKQYSPVYTYSKDRMIELLGIERDEMKNMTALIDTREKYDRKNEKRSTTGLSREEYEGKSLSKTKPWEAMGISRATYYRRVKAGEISS
ncbi:hypothetical protein [Sulfitobacter sp. HGT1]|uniref:hypothetical protein n=1 Tax=Sulfitobacter sp. HGT1 TaxID=2735435 RepID=UPI0015939D19|nr:hypothetical protein [Sulfitobacter sp. HGT1]